jgi:ribosome production factor 2
MDFYRGEELPIAQGLRPGEHQIALSGLQHVICVTAGAMNAGASAAAEGKEAAESALNGTSASAREKDQLADLYAAGNALEGQGTGASGTGGAQVDRSAEGCIIHLRTYALDLRASGSRQPRVELQECGPSFDFVVRRRRPAGYDMLCSALKRPKTSLEKSTQGKGKRKNIDTDDMGDMVGQVHLGKQDLDKLQVRKMKGLKAGVPVPEQILGDEDDDDDDDEEDYSDDQDDDEELEMEDMTMPNGDLDGGEEDEEDGEDEEEEAASSNKRPRRV